LPHTKNIEHANRRDPGRSRMIDLTNLTRIDLQEDVEDSFPSYYGDIKNILILIICCNRSSE